MGCNSILLIIEVKLQGYKYKCLKYGTREWGIAYIFLQDWFTNPSSRTQYATIFGLRIERPLS